MNEVTISIDALRQLLADTTKSVPSAPNQPNESSAVGKYCVIRGDRSGVFCGTVMSVDPATNTVWLTEARHVWTWWGAANTAEMAAWGLAQPDMCKIVEPVGKIEIWDVIEVIPCTYAAEASLRAVPIWSAR